MLRHGCLRIVGGKLRERSRKMILEWLYLIISRIINMDSLHTKKAAYMYESEGFAKEVVRYLQIIF
jgi:hypothetical protein